MAPFIRCATLDGYIELAASLGLDPAGQAARVGLDVGDLARPDRWIPAAAVARLLENAAADSGAEDFGLRLSERRRLATLGPLSVVLREEPDLRSALLLLVRYEYSYNEALSLRLTEAGEPASLRLEFCFGEPVPTRQALELGVAGLVGIIGQLIGTGWRAQAVCFSHGPPGRLATHRRLLGPRLRFDQDFSGVVFRAGELADANVLADPLLEPYRPELLRVLPKPRLRTVVEEVRALVEALLPIGRESMRHVARSLGVTTRTLRRRLEQERATYSSIVDDTRSAMAQRYLAGDRLSLTDISYQLGFGAPSAFSRWFRRRFGMSPTAWRRGAPEPTVGASAFGVRPREELRPGHPLPSPAI